MSKYFAPFLLCVICSAQVTQSQTQKLDPVRQMEAQRAASGREGLDYNSPTYMEEQLQRGQIAHLMAERQAQLRRDTEKLVALTAELKEHVAKSGPNILSMDVIKKAAEIQKLAKSVEEKMKNAY